MNTKRILKVIIKRMADTDGQPDWLGAYSNTPGPEATTIDRRTLGHWKPGEYCFFIADNVETWEQAFVNYTRMEAGMNGGWHLMGVRAEAEVVLTGTAVQTLTSGGLWGVESDADDTYMRVVELEQMDGLKDVLRAVGFTDGEITAAFEKVDHVNAL